LAGAGVPHPHGAVGKPAWTEIATLQRECRSRASDLPTHGARARRCSRQNCKFRAISARSDRGPDARGCCGR
jgi:hypothetical protein